MVDTEEVWREVRMPGEDVSDLPQEVQEEIGKEWTPELLSAYEDWLISQDPSVVISPKKMTPKQQRMLSEAKVKVEEIREEATMTAKRLMQ
jgi:hypothetical protein